MMGWDRYHIPVEFINFGIDFAEDFIKTHWQAFVNVTINDDMITQNIIQQFEEVLNSSESGLLNDNTLKYGSQQYWVQKELEPVGEILHKGFNIANFMHEEKWVRRRILNTISRPTYLSDNWSATDLCIDPDKIERTEKTHLHRKSVVHDNSVDIREWMATQQRMTHGKEWDGADFSDDDKVFWTAAEGETNEPVQESDDQSQCGWRISPTWDIPEGLVPHNDFEPPSDSEDQDEEVVGDIRWIMETDESDELPNLAYVSGSSDIEDDLGDNISEWSDQDYKNNPNEALQTADLPMEFDHAGSRCASLTLLASEDDLEALGDLPLGVVAVENGTQKRRERHFGPAEQATWSGKHDYQGSTSQTAHSAHHRAAINRSEKKSQKKNWKGTR
ncbi:hypothetical protein FRC04_000897 [Tulasnella sp. 424]|nr:hypothetical protein FRC04_000897 [Tulasnella sp. 424]KAG8975367.1 hypothetical protein FRC05_005697 [Tulasnella sp. 425]